MVVHYPRTVWKNSYAEHEITGKTYTQTNESMVTFVSRRYMRGENGIDSLMVCLSRIAIFVFQNNVIKAYRSVLLIRIGKQNVKIIYI